jgi:hypothetical protein
LGILMNTPVRYRSDKALEPAVSLTVGGFDSHRPLHFYLIKSRVEPKGDDQIESIVQNRMNEGDYMRRNLSL